MSTPVLSCQNVTHAFRDEPLFQNLSLTFHKGERVVITGPNGAGKSTLMKILAGDLIADEGRVIVNRGVSIQRVPQTREYSSATVTDVLMQLSDNHVIVDKMMSLAALDPQSNAKDLSGGMQRRLTLCEALVQQPDVLLLDEPTNHLDNEGIDWLESTLKSLKVTWIAVTHDRAFMDELASRVIEISPRYPARYFESQGSYSQFLIARDQFVRDLHQKHQSMMSRSRLDDAWLRQGPKARTSRDQGRLKQAVALKGELESLTQTLSKSSSQIQFQQGDKRGKVLIHAKNVSFGYESQKPIVKNLEFILPKGMRVGVLGANGVGKSTLLKTLMKKINPQSGSVFHVDGLRVAYLDQMRGEINPEWTLAQALCPEGDMVSYPGGQVHVVTWAKKFCLDTEQLRTQIKNLSGGEKARVHIAQLMRQPADVFVLDEPTNDLDIDTIEQLENALEEFSGAMFIVSHDRWFLDQLCHFVLVPETQDKGRWTLCADRKQAQALMMVPTAETTPKQVVKSKESKRVQLSWKEQKELSGMEKAIAKEELKIDQLEMECAQPEIQGESERLEKIWNDLSCAKQKVEELYARWEFLEDKKLNGL